MHTFGISHEQIVAYGSRHQDECGLGVDWSEAKQRCWRCGFKCKLYRCHIIPDSLGGLARASNLVLLCRRCHREAPNVADPRFMWIWLRATSVPLYDTFWTERGFEEFERMFGRKPFVNSAFDELTEGELRILLREQIKRTAIHLGEGRPNPSTMACVIALIEERVTGQLPITIRSHRPSTCKAMSKPKTKQSA